jgi:hypothetical protein
VIGILEFNSFLAGTGYPTGKNTHAGTGMGKILYPRVYMGNPTGRIFFDRYGYGMVLPDGYVPVAIPNVNYVKSDTNDKNTYAIYCNFIPHYIM